MNLNAVGVSSRDLKKTIEFYSLLGFQFPKMSGQDKHVESLHDNGAKLMIDDYKLVSELIGEAPKPGNHSTFAIQYDSPQHVDRVAQKVKQAGFVVKKDPWDSFWGQRYAVVVDPDGYHVDLYASL